MEKGGETWFRVQKEGDVFELTSKQTKVLFPF